MKPKRITISIFDPWTKDLCMSADLPWNPRYAAMGIYSRQARRMKQHAPRICPAILESRTPKLRIEYTY